MTTEEAKMVAVATALARVTSTLGQLLKTYGFMSPDGGVQGRKDLTTLTEFLETIKNGDIASATYDSTTLLEVSVNASSSLRTAVVVLPLDKLRDPDRG